MTEDPDARGRSDNAALPSVAGAPEVRPGAPWIRLLPQWLQAKLNERLLLQAVIANTSWIFGERFLRLAVGAVVGVWTARYLGAGQFGTLSFAVAFAALFAPLAVLGLDGLLVRDLVRRSDPGSTLGTAFVLKGLGGTAALALSVGFSLLIRPGDALSAQLIAVLAAATIFQAADVVELWFQSKISARHSVRAKTAAFVVMATMRVGLILAKAPLVAFAWALFFETALGALGLALVFRGQEPKISSWRFSRTRAVELLSESWPLLMSGLAIMVYMRIDVVMLGAMLSDRAAGVYSAAVTLSEALYFIPVAVVTSVAPVLARSKQESEALYYSRLRMLFSGLALFALLVAIPMTFASGPVIRALFGATFEAAGRVLSVHIWALLFVCLGVAAGPWFVNEQLTHLALLRTATGAALNIGINWLLIPTHGALGAAIATVVSYSASAVLLNAASARTRPLFASQLAWLKPWRHRAPSRSR